MLMNRSRFFFSVRSLQKMEICRWMKSLCHSQAKSQLAQKISSINNFLSHRWRIRRGRKSSEREEREVNYISRNKWTNWKRLSECELELNYGWSVSLIRSRNWGLKWKFFLLWWASELGRLWKTEWFLVWSWFCSKFCSNDQLGHKNVQTLNYNLT